MSSILLFLLIAAVGAAAWYLFVRKNDDTDNIAPPSVTPTSPESTPAEDTTTGPDWSK